MKKPLRTAAASKPAVRAAPPAPQRKAKGAGGAKPVKKSAIDRVIARELAPAAAIAVLDRSPHAKDAATPALDVLVAGVSDASEDGKLRVQLMFDNGAVLPVEMSDEAAKKLEAGLAREREAKA